MTPFYALALAALLLALGCIVVVAGCWLRSLYRSVEEEQELQIDSVDQARKAATRRRTQVTTYKSQVIISVLVYSSAMMSAARAAVPAPQALAAAEAPSGTEQWLTILAFLLGLVIAIMQVVNFLRGSKIQMPLEVRETLKFTSADAMTRHCKKQDEDLRRIEQHAEETVGEIRKELHNLGREVSDMNGRSEQRDKRMERMEHLLTELLQRTPPSGRPR